MSTLDTLRLVLAKPHRAGQPFIAAGAAVAIAGLFTGYGVFWLGLVARRILCEVRPGDAVRAGARFGIIRFGSRTDVYLPPGVTPLVAVGQTMVGGETVLASLAAGA